MSNRYDHKKIEKKWQKKWERQKLYKTPDAVSKPAAAKAKAGKKNFYTLVEFPYPSGDLHVGHWYAFAVPDIFARYKRMQGFNVLYPIGFDAFGLPAENAAIKNKIDPAKWTSGNIKRMRGQLHLMGNSFDWSREMMTCDPAYYKWTQWLFLKFHEKGLAYKKKAVVNWDPVDQTVLANEQVLPDGTGERSGAKVEKRELEQWFYKITDYVDRLVDDLEDLDWPESIKAAQRNWIGRSEGCELTFDVVINGKKIAEIPVFTTRPDTLFSGWGVMLAPEHELTQKLLSHVRNKDEIIRYIEQSKKKSEIERTAEGKEKTGVELKGICAKNPGSGKEIRIFVADYVLANFGTGAIFAAAHDTRDVEFAKKYKIAVYEVLEPVFTQQTEPGKVVEGLPFEHRKTIIGIVKHWSEDKYIALKWKKVAWGTFVTGGIEEGQTPEEAAKMEIREETGFLHPTLVSDFGMVHSTFYHVPKKVNRFAHARVLHFKLEDDAREEISQAEQEKHEVFWMTKEELDRFITATSHRFALQFLSEKKV